MIKCQFPGMVKICHSGLRNNITYSDAYPDEVYMVKCDPVTDMIWIYNDGSTIMSAMTRT